MRLKMLPFRPDAVAMRVSLLYVNDDAIWSVTINKCIYKYAFLDRFGSENAKFRSTNCFFRFVFDSYAPL